MREKGFLAEAAAESYLAQQGLSLVCRNFHCKAGEIDLIMMQRETLVFVEVRYRQDSKHGSPLETITPSKQRKLLRAVKYYLLKHNLWDAPCRIDALGMTPSSCGEFEFNWQQNAIYDD